MAQGCTLCFRLETARTRGGNDASTSSLHTIERYALNRNGFVGSLYNARTDNLLTTLSINKDLLLRKDVKKIPTCKLIKVDNSNRDNLLKLIGIEDDLKVSITLGMTPVTEGTLLLHTYEVPPDRTIRLIDYHHVDQEECLSNDIQIVRKNLPDSLPNSNATHIITSVRRGIDFVIVLELPENVNLNEIDSVLEKLREYFSIPEAASLSTEDQQKINRLQPIIFTSITEIHSFAENKDLIVICQYIHQYIYQNRNNFPLSYTLHPLKCIYYDKLSNEKIYGRLSSSIVWQIEDKLLPLSNRLKRIERLFHEKMLSQLPQSAKSLIGEPGEDLCKVKDMYIEVQQALATKVDELRRDTLNISLRNNVLNDTQLQALDSELKTLQTTILGLQTKARFITKLKTDYQMEYLNVADLEDRNNDQETLESKLFSSDQEHSRCYLCSTNELVETYSHEFEKFCEQLIKLRQKNLSLRLVFADFTYCSDKLKSMKILQPPASFLPTPSVIKPNELNILLIGETGVGKSTFINAFVNYLAFQSFREAENSDPIVLIPISFSITIGNNFEEQKIEFDEPDSNEDHNNSGQSVTQHCKSYIFTIGNNIKLRIIDTPGIGDTRGAEQDNKNIECILSYTNCLPHLNAICFLLKPNATRLHALFRSCFTQLFNFLGPNARKNVIFCFTNTRATFYAPGDTAKLLKKMLNELPDDHIPLFAKENTFCFDSESFRYLAIIKTGHKLPFDNDEKLNFEKSWTISVVESTRLLDLIKSRPKYEMNKWHSIKHAQMMITLLVRPILETIRNALRNLVLWDLDNRQRIIELKAQPISLPACLCTNCSYKTTQIGNISIVTHPIQYYRASNECSICHDVLDKHLSVFYELEYHLGGIKGTRFQSDTENLRDRLLHGSLIMTQFLLYVAHISENPFLPWFHLLVQEEQQFYQKEAAGNFHENLYKSILNLKNKYEKCVNENHCDQDPISVDAIYGCIDEVLKYPSISEQMNAIKASQMEMMENCEHDVSDRYPHTDMTCLLKPSTTTTNH
jgi:hypothetical protein